MPAVIKTLPDIAPTLKARRQQLGIRQSDMHMKIGMPQQQYQKMEAGGDMRLSSLLRIAEGLGLVVMLAPKDELQEMADVAWPESDWEKALAQLADDDDWAQGNSND